MKSKFVSALKVADHANELHKIQLKIAELKKQVKELEVTETQLTNYLIKFSKGLTFNYNSDGYQKVVKIGNHSRQIMDQAACLKLLKARTPYTPCEWTTVKVDFIYES